MRTNNQRQQQCGNRNVACGIEPGIHSEQDHEQFAECDSPASDGRGDYRHQNYDREEFLREPMEVRRQELVYMIHEKSIGQIAVEVLVQPKSVRIYKSDDRTRGSCDGEKLSLLQRSL